MIYILNISYRWITIGVQDLSGTKNIGFHCILSGSGYENKVYRKQELFANLSDADCLVNKSSLNLTVEQMNPVSGFI